MPRGRLRRHARVTEPEFYGSGPEMCCNLEAAAQIVGVNQMQVRRWAADGDISAEDQPPYLTFRVTSLLVFVAAREAKSPEYRAAVSRGEIPYPPWEYFPPRGDDEAVGFAKAAWHAQMTFGEFAVVVADGRVPFELRDCRFVFARSQLDEFRRTR